MEPDPIYDTGSESSDDSFYDDSASEAESEVSDGPTPDSGLLVDRPWANDPPPAHAIWEENRSGNCPKAFWRSYQAPPSFTAPMPDPTHASWGPEFGDNVLPAEVPNTRIYAMPFPKIGILKTSSLPMFVKEIMNTTRLHTAI
ncbi:hypothetical protein FEM48_Zijuj12G0142900 [Ziziphus jujuba var. spinosa]|uniref:Uncharacterized protein n=1 Tax=Ziziphus jujuba var. spinosa TaxID=714518 RepID=A0A978UDU0_ZIZJJ|nr:hypothetical protein FEM48_Zijuj12G0142900 [Ziziphus jujuba var. spinosa]